MVTNLRGYGKPARGRTSRGILVKDALTNKDPLLDPSDTDLFAFNPFNLIIAAEQVFRLGV